MAAGAKYREFSSWKIVNILQIISTRRVSALETSQFVLLVDPFLKEVYQVDTLASRARLNGVGISDAQVPTHVDFDPRSGLVYWFDAGDANVVKRAPLLEASSARIVMTLPAGIAFILA